MTENTLLNSAAATQTYINPIAVRFFEFLDSCANELQENGKLTFSSIEKILGKPPVIPASPDMDARLEAYEELTQYSNRVLDIESKIRTYAEEKRS